MAIEPGAEIRAKSDPGRIGVVLKKTRDLDGTTYQPVHLSDRPRFLRISDMEPIDARNENPLDLLSRVKFRPAYETHRFVTCIFPSISSGISSTNRELAHLAIAPRVRARVADTEMSGRTAGEVNEDFPSAGPKAVIGILAAPFLLLPNCDKSSSSSGCSHIG